MCPIYDSIIKTIELPYTNTLTIISSQSFGENLDYLFKLCVIIDTEDESWFCVDKNDWSHYSKDDYELNNYNIINKISLIDTTWSDVNRYEIEGEFKSILRENGSTRLKPASGRYRFEALLHKS